MSAYPKTRPGGPIGPRDQPPPKTTGRDKNLVQTSKDMTAKQHVKSADCICSICKRAAKK